MNIDLESIHSITVKNIAL